MTQQDQLKSQVEAGQYRPQPALVAEAMLQHRGVLDLLTNDLPAFNATRQGRSLPDQAGRSQSVSVVPRQAA